MSHATDQRMGHIFVGFTDKVTDQSRCQLTASLEQLSQ
jgi:hypothetical protein